MIEGVTIDGLTDDTVKRTEFLQHLGQKPDVVVIYHQSLAGVKKDSPTQAIINLLGRTSHDINFNGIQNMDSLHADALGSSFVYMDLSDVVANPGETPTQKTQELSDTQLRTFLAKGANALRSVFDFYKNNAPPEALAQVHIDRKFCVTATNLSEASLRKGLGFNGITPDIIDKLVIIDQTGVDLYSKLDDELAKTRLLNSSKS